MLITYVFFAPILAFLLGIMIGDYTHKEGTK